MKAHNGKTEELPVTPALCEEVKESRTKCHNRLASLMKSMPVKSVAADISQSSGTELRESIASISQAYRLGKKGSSL